MCNKFKYFEILNNVYNDPCSIWFVISAYSLLIQRGNDLISSGGLRLLGSKFVFPKEGYAIKTTEH
jgi:hypothetical protein